MGEPHSGMEEQKPKAAQVPAIPVQRSPQPGALSFQTSFYMQEIWTFIFNLTDLGFLWHAAHLSVYIYNTQTSLIGGHLGFLFADSGDKQLSVLSCCPSHNADRLLLADMEGMSWNTWTWTKGSGSSSSWKLLEMKVLGPYPTSTKSVICFNKHYRWFRRF